MSTMVIAQVLIVVATAGAAGLGARYLFGGYRPLAAERAALARTSAAQRSGARAVIAAQRTGGGDEQVDPVVAVVAVDMAVRGREAAYSLTMVVLAVSQVLLATSWLLVALVVTAAANAGVAAALLVRRAGARRFLAARPELEVPSRTAWWAQ